MTHHSAKSDPRQPTIPSPSALNAKLAEFNIRVHHPDDGPTITREPQSTMRPILWRRDDLVRLLHLVGTAVGMEAGGYRRTLRLTNPGLPYGTTPTFWGSIQHILPGEVATAHRHSPHAFRFIMKGSGASTTVDGEHYPMNKGDIVLTPAWTWHDHQHHGTEPMTWLDGLDISLVRSVHASFFEPYTQSQQPSASIPDRSLREFGSGIMRPMNGPPLRRNASPLLVYPWARAEQALRDFSATEPDPFDDFVLEYQNPTTGGPALSTLGLALQWLRPGMRGRTHRHTGSVLYHVVRGEGSTIIANECFDWGEGDFVALPPWSWHAHTNRSETDEAILFQVNDFPAMTALGLYREEARLAGHQ